MGRKMMKLTEKIAATPFFEGLNTEQLDALADIAVERPFQRGEMIFSEGEEAAGLYAVGEGRVKVFKLSLDGKEQILHMFGPGEVFGEVAVFAGSRFPAYSQAVEKSIILFFPRPRLRELVRSHPDLALGMLGLMSLRLRRFAALIEDLSLKEVPARLAAYLLVLADRNDSGREGAVELDVTKTQLAGILGTIPETLSRILGRMARDEVVQVDGRLVRILDRDRLEELSRAESKLT
jgi:CRP/FNR family transcriptional regulator